MPNGMLGWQPLSLLVSLMCLCRPIKALDTDLGCWLVIEYHPSCSCSMLPLSQGGVVDAALKVYGVSNLRVADSSVYPIQFAAHLMVSLYFSSSLITN